MKQIALFLVLALPALAQWRRFGDREIRPTGFVGLGAAAPVNPIARDLKPGFHMSGGAGIQYGYFGLMLDGMYNKFGLTRDALIQQGARRGHQDYWAVTIDPIVHVNPRGPVDFYLTGGVGVYGQYTSLRASSGGRFDDRYDLFLSRHITRPGANLGAGFSFHLGRGFGPKAFAEARYHHMFTPGSASSFVPVTVGVRF